MLVQNEDEVRVGPVSFEFTPTDVEIDAKILRVRSRCIYQLQAPTTRSDPNLTTNEHIDMLDGWVSAAACERCLSRAAMLTPVALWSGTSGRRATSWTSTARPAA